MAGFTRFVILEVIVVRNVLHDVLNIAVENIAQLVNGIDLYILIMPQSV